MQGLEASSPGALAGLPSTLRTVIGTPTTSPPGLVSSQTVPTTVQTASSLSRQQIEENLQHVISSISSDYDPERVVAAGGNSNGSTGKGILIGILSAFGSAAIAFIVLAIFFFFKYTRRGRIMLDRIGRPGEYDDEQAFAREEEAALEEMDDLTRSEYLRAKGNVRETHVAVRSANAQDSLGTSQSAGVHANRYLAIAVPRYPRKGRLCVGIPTGARDCQLLCGGTHGN